MDNLDALRAEGYLHYDELDVEQKNQACFYWRGMGRSTCMKTSLYKFYKGAIWSAVPTNEECWHVRDQ